MDKVIRNGKVAVIYSPGYGAGWSTWVYQNKEASIFDPEIVEWIEAGKPDFSNEKLECLEKKYGHLGGLKNNEITWLPKGTQFRIDEYDGSESIQLLEDMAIMTA